MRNSIKKAIGETVQDFINSGLKTSFTEKELNSLGVTIPEVRLTNNQIKEIREKLSLSQKKKGVKKKGVKSHYTMFVVSVV
jgi:putative transcriptional regulator